MILVGRHGFCCQTTILCYLSFDVMPLHNNLKYKLFLNKIMFCHDFFYGVSPNMGTLKTLSLG